VVGRVLGPRASGPACGSPVRPRLVPPLLPLRRTRAFALREASARGIRLRLFAPVPPWRVLSRSFRSPMGLMCSSCLLVRSAVLCWAVPASRAGPTLPFRCVCLCAGFAVLGFCCALRVPWRPVAPGCWRLFFLALVVAPWFLPAGSPGRRRLVGPDAWWPGVQPAALARCAAWPSAATWIAFVHVPTGASRRLSAPPTACSPLLGLCTVVPALASDSLTRCEAVRQGRSAGLD